VAWPDGQLVVDVAALPGQFLGAFGGGGDFPAVAAARVLDPAGDVPPTPGPGDADPDGRVTGRHPAGLPVGSGRGGPRVAWEHRSQYPKSYSESRAQEEAAALSLAVAGLDRGM
jgi:hypothetical protein